ncbi:TRAP dicarboxylate transporter, DctM subunit [Neorhizobium galegae bv. officinalis bv. officinalis str. HAMBI 1141]|uniref:TRAP transporter large permease protein n=1 Tax=Neorhizobium galegae bv. officinalis bv. officinalis str. HAMBI 1141 TaxID=1028801 RepID=A0A068TDI4_NEOGA|nr:MULTISPECIES: TRAP transporter large permease subunit [Neorhizobium]MCJ9750291.1 TRAP transporter large permease subunit [Neorhizobium sp. BETTINA12A]CDN56473.1 TRAP dicarboxylate transporter, DctM subunit [Neorhizobium galegae bv. officinalis bv. officinalis str. HAMBI 1141]
MDTTFLVEISGLILGAMLILLMGGVWIGIALLICGFIAMQFAPAGIQIGAAMATNAWSGSASWSLAALPLFIWMGEILYRTRLSDEMFRGLSPWLNWLPGRLVHVNVLGCGLFGAVSGSSAATTAMVAKITLPELKKRGYDENISLGSLAGAGTLGFLVPPSIPMIVYAVAANVSIIQMFMAGLIPAVIVMILYMGAIVVWSLMNPDKSPAPAPKTSFPTKLKETLNLIPLALLILTVFSALMLGWATATECAAWGVLGALVIAASQRALTWRSFIDSVLGATRMTSMVMLILTGAGYMSIAMGYTGIPNALAAWVDSFQLSPYALIAVLTLMYVLLGCAIDGLSMIVLTTVVVLPMIQQAGFDLIWFGIFLVLMVEMAQITPPVGFNLFVLQTMSGRDSLTVARAALPFFFLLLATVAILTIFPDIVMFLPKMAFPG